MKESSVTSIGDSQESASSPSRPSGEAIRAGESSLMWVDKYKPTQLKQIVGQTGEKSNARKLLHWLTNWHKNRAAGTKPQGRNVWGKGLKRGRVWGY